MPAALIPSYSLQPARTLNQHGTLDASCTSTTYRLRASHALVLKLNPTLAILVAITKPAETNIVAPQKASRLVHPLRRAAPAMGLPMSKPKAMGTNNIPLRVPTTPKEGESVKTMVGGRETKLPEKNLDFEC